MKYTKKQKEKCMQRVTQEPSLEESITQETEGSSPPVFLVIEESNESADSIQTSVQDDIIKQ